MNKVISLLKCFMITLFFISLSSNLSSCYPESVDIYMFDEISECQKIISSDLYNFKFVQYNRDEVDRNSGELSYIDCFAGNFESDELNFQIYAFCFENTNCSKQYFKKYANKNTDSETTFQISGGFISNSREIVVIDQEKAYYITVSKCDLEEVLELLSTIFTKQLDFTK